MRARLLAAATVLVAGTGAAALATSVATASSAPHTLTLGSTSGTPSQNVCGAGVDCTYLPLSGVSIPALEVPFEGSVTSFSINAASAGGTVELRVLRPAGGGRYTGAGTSALRTLSTGINTFLTSLPVKTGDLLGLENASSALMFDTTAPTAITAYFEPHLADGATAAPNHDQNRYRLLLSATVRASSVTTPSGATGSPAPLPSIAPPVVSDVGQSHRTWREGNGLVQISASRRPRRSPVGTTFSFSLNEPAKVTLSFAQTAPGRRVGGSCVAESHANARRRSCKRTSIAPRLSFSGHRGRNKVAFQGRLSRASRLRAGAYTLVIRATSAGRKSAPRRLRFAIVR